MIWKPPVRLTPIDQPYPKLIGVELIEATPTRVIGKLEARGELCRSGETLHGGAILALADIVASQGAFLNLPGRRRHDDHRDQDEFHQRAEEGRADLRRGHPAAYRPAQLGVADQGHARGR